MFKRKNVNFRWPATLSFVTESGNENERFSRGKLRVFYKGETADHRFFSDEFAEELSTNLETFASVFKRQMSTIRLIKEFRYYVDPKAFPDVKPRAYENFAKDLTKLCKTYGVTIKCIGGVSLHSQDEMKKLLGYSSDLDSGDILPIWRD